MIRYKNSKVSEFGLTPDNLIPFFNEQHMIKISQCIMNILYSTHVVRRYTIHRGSVPTIQFNRVDVFTYKGSRYRTGIISLFLNVSKMPNRRRKQNNKMGEHVLGAHIGTRNPDTMGSAKTEALTSVSGMRCNTGRSDPNTSTETADHAIQVTDGANQTSRDQVTGDDQTMVTSTWRKYLERLATRLGIRGGPRVNALPQYSFLSRWWEGFSNSSIAKSAVIQISRLENWNFSLNNSRLTALMSGYSNILSNILWNVGDTTGGSRSDTTGSKSGPKSDRETNLLNADRDSHQMIPLVVVVIFMRLAVGCTDEGRMCKMNVYERR
jgi:hypothetical protein